MLLCVWYCNPTKNWDWQIKTLSVSQACPSLDVNPRAEKKMLLQAESSWYLSNFPTFSEFNLKTFKAVSMKKKSTLNPKLLKIWEQEGIDSIFWQSDALIKCREMGSDHCSPFVLNSGEILLWAPSGLPGDQHPISESPCVRLFQKVYLSSSYPNTPQNW